MSLAEKYREHYTIEDYKQWQGDWELIEGIPFAMAPSPFADHQIIISQIDGSYEIAFDGTSGKFELEFNNCKISLKVKEIFDNI